MDRLKELGVEVIAQERGAAWIVDGSLLRWTLRSLVREDGGRLIVPDESRPVLQYYANSIAHHFGAPIAKATSPEGSAKPDVESGSFQKVGIA